PPARTATSPARRIESLRQLLLGFDAGPAGPRQVLDDYLAAREADVIGAAIQAEAELLGVVADLCELSPKEPVEAGGADTAVHSPRESFLAYLRMLDVERAGVPERFATRVGLGLG